MKNFLTPLLGLKKKKLGLEICSARPMAFPQHLTDQGKIGSWSGQHHSLRCKQILIGKTRPRRCYSSPPACRIREITTLKVVALELWILQHQRPRGN
ncbi:hypothetical protein CSPX01_08627 [Colletotrichum filicis]|nr:hypothetical protein CSPX01_08627 [Colletotrichum filicis]